MAGADLGRGIVVTVLATHGTPARIGAGVAMVVAAVAVHVAEAAQSVRVTMLTVGVATVAGLAAVLIGPSGLGEIPVFLAASRIAVPIDRGWGRVFVVVDTLAVAGRGRLRLAQPGRAAGRARCPSLPSARSSAAS